MQMRVEREVAASAERVWGIIVDLDRSPMVLSGIDRIERLDRGSGFEVGTRWRETRTMFGRQATEDMEVTGIDPGRSYTVSAGGGGGTDYLSTLAVEPIGDARCRLSMAFAATPSGLPGKLAAVTVGRLFQKATRRMLQRDLDDIASHAEAPQAPR
jgi:carbon monoxide dehydrogenase subunit G